MRKAIGYVVVLACGVLILGGLSAAAADDDKKKDDKPAAPSGTWVRQEGQLKIEFSGKDALKLYPHGDDTIVIVCEHSAAKGQVKVKITDFEGTKQEAK